MRNEVLTIQKQIKQSLGDYKIQLELIRNAENFDDKKVQKKIIKEMEKSVEVVERASQELEKTLKSNTVK